MNEFLKELHALLAKHKAEIEAEDHFEGYAECGQDIRMTIIFANYRTSEINLGKWIDGNGHGGSG